MLDKVLVCVIMLLLDFAPVVYAQNTRLLSTDKNIATSNTIDGSSTTDISSTAPGETMQSCSDEGLGVEFPCMLAWPMKNTVDALEIQIATDPQVNMVIKKSESDGFVLSKITKDYLNKTNLYADGFVLTPVSINSADMIRVTGTSKNFPYRQIEDFYMMNGNELISVMFSVEPNILWGKYAEVFQYIIDNLNFR
ncbi:MAG: hypothetical protein HQL26_03030 [Candidatus Omnitrophica bacterium]|nr:hypothetical protein [Candidatus Omnitrophota bacterium]